MKRRDVIRILPLSIAGMAGLTGHALSEQIPVKKKSGHNEPLSMQYIAKVIDMLTWIRENQSEN